MTDGHFDVGVAIYNSVTLCDTAVLPIIPYFISVSREGDFNNLFPWHQICCTEGRYNSSLYSGCVMSNFLNISGKLDDTQE